MDPLIKIIVEEFEDCLFCIAKIRVKVRIFPDGSIWFEEHEKVNVETLNEIYFAIDKIIRNSPNNVTSEECETIAKNILYKYYPQYNFDV